MERDVLGCLPTWSLFHTEEVTSFSRVPSRGSWRSCQDGGGGVVGELAASDPGKLQCKWGEVSGKGRKLAFTGHLTSLELNTFFLL